jgi:voltage-gated potassium channel
VRLRHGLPQTVGRVASISCSVVPVRENRAMADPEAKLSYRERAYRLLETPSPDRPSSRLATIFLTVLILGNVAAAILQSVERFADRYSSEFAAFEGFSLVVFALEYFARLWSAGVNPQYAGLSGTVRFATRPMMLIDAVATFPSLLFPAIDFRALRLLRVFRLLRGLKLVRYSKGLQIILAVFREKRDQLILCLGFVAVLVVLSASVMYYAENPVQPEEFSSIPAAMWWSVCTLTTVGYGDVVPKTEIGRLLASVISVLGVGLFALPAGILAAGFGDHMTGGGQTLKCEQCGKVLE